ncbi:MAG TPA: hypothetical protein DHH42_06490 [Clostridiales bacterium]|nr:hypothetical protein [Clostridiales bacterium]
MTQEELNRIIEQDTYLKERENPSPHDTTLFLREVSHHCPLCGKELIYKGQKKKNKLYQIAHIYPNRPTIAQYEALNGVERLGDNSESFENKIALCFDCHSTQDYHTSLSDYNRLLSIKKKLLEQSAISNAIRSLDLENDISIIVLQLSNLSDVELSELNYDPVYLTNKFENNELLIKRRIEGYVHSYFPFVRDRLKEIDGKNGFNQQVLASQIRNCYLKMRDKCTNKSVIFSQMTDWLNNKTLSISKDACEVVIAFFVQSCEVFDEITK